MKSILLIGMNRFGSLLAKQFHEQGHQVMAIDKDEDRINENMPYVTDAEIGDSTNQVFLQSLGISNYDVCIVAIGKDFQSSLETTSLLKEFGGRLVVSRAESDMQEKFLLRNGADAVINPEKHAAEWAAVTYASEQILDYNKLDDRYGIFEVTIPKECLNRTIEELDIRRKHGINILAVKENGTMTLPVDPATFLTEDMTLLVLGEMKVIQKVFKV